MTGAFANTADIVLASASPRRKELLASTGVDFDVVVSAVEEPAPDEGETPGGYALRLACLKARDVARIRPGAFVLGADTVVAVGEHILGKPVDKDDAARMISLLAGREHTVVTACCLLGPDGEPVWAEPVSTLVRFGPLTPQTIASYAATGESLDKAGGYAIQGLGGFMIESIDGSYSNVVGLPLAETVHALALAGAICPRRTCDQD